MSLNDGHRERLRRRFENEGLDHFEPHEVLELLLFFVIPRGNVNHIAHRLIQRFHSISGVMHASKQELMEIEGIGEQSAFFLKLLPDVCRRYMVSTVMDKMSMPITDSAAVIDYVRPHFIGRTVETLFLLCINSAGLPISCNYISEGTVNATQIDLRKILEIVTNSKAVAVILCHNHPGGLSIPSRADIDMTNQLRDLLSPIGVTLLDHLIFSEDDCVSLYDSLIYDPRKK